MNRSLFYNTSIHEAAKMINCGDKDILENSRGEVTHIYDPDNTEVEDSPLNKIENSDLDPGIFGELNKENVEGSMAMGHISLNHPILNINYLNGTRPILPSLLGMSHADIDRVVYFASHLIVKSNNKDYPVGKILTEAELEGASGIETRIGAEAIETLMKIKGLETEGVILHYIPVLPYPFRYHKVPCNKEGAFRSCYVDFHYRRILNRIHRLGRLKELGAPDIILRNECRMLQEYVDAYINNGARGRLMMNWYGEPYDSLQSAVRFIEGRADHINKKDMEPFDKVDLSKVIEIAKEIGKLEDEDEDVRYNDEDGKLKDLFVKAEGEVMDAFMDIVETRYPNLADFYPVLYNAGVNSFECILENYGYGIVKGEADPKDDDLKDVLFSGVIHCMDIRSHNLAFA